MRFMPENDNQRHCGNRGLQGNAEAGYISPSSAPRPPQPRPESSAMLQHVARSLAMILLPERPWAGMP